MTDHATYMCRCIELARNGEGTTSPNPMVGCVIVRGGQIIGEGYHHRAGEPHAEVNAIASITDAEALKEATLYVNLEPCSHWGKTPPCADLIIARGIPRVVVGMIDPFAAVCGNGIRKLREAGIEVEVGVLEQECRELNSRFITYHSQRRPYITLKWAQTADGYLDNNRPADTPATWMTGAVARTLVHRLRAVSDAILVGTRTVERDNPALTVREAGGKSPLRVVLDRSLRLDPSAQVFDGNTDTLVFTQVGNRSAASERYSLCEVAEIDFPSGWQAVLEVLYARNVQSLFVEGGAAVLASLIEAGLWDEAYIFVSPLTVNDLAGGSPTEPLGIKAPSLPEHLRAEKQIDGTSLYYFQRKTDV
ncbi:MAG: bifunctional diaminohydroxyphosphoribosylaminopyrimidine deaminase/5-amino-6-(5-phosphoribosylamino)uracil reductase RibD [Rikenellaceae bacterium]|jgi:diaminohydroxyphosphoribosylaminopyrimidine deaminase/5-amino-6-(5-phosphoribosylamino)uracil reductase|nr:bifunctional diaminohydroxyphosphoribosylaminopyrimidine deaminase/5-amino-6-(5-phosphoribosylamino)uracil reductase RibD [Rikenellaceae bacterium]